MTNGYDRLRSEQQRVAALVAQARPVPTTAVATGPAGVPVRVTGTAQPGPGGLLRAPLSGAECVWYQSWRVSTTRPWSPSTALPGDDAPRPLPAGASSTLPFVSTSGVVPPVRDRSATPFVVADATGRVLVDPAGAHVDTTVQAANEVRAEPGGDWTGGELLVEWIIPPGAPVVVLGAAGVAPDGSVRLGAPAGARLVVSTAGVEQLAAKAQAWTARPGHGAPGATGDPDAAGAPEWVARLVTQAAPVATAAARPGQLVALDGWARPGPGGPARGALSGRPCVWSRTLETPVRDRLAPLGFSAADPLGPLVTGALPPDPLPGGPPFEVVDAQGAAVLDPRGAWVDSGTVTVDAFERGRGPGVDPHGVLRREWIVAPGQRVLVVGTAQRDPDGTLRVTGTPAAPLVVSTRPAVDLLAAPASPAPSARPRDVGPRGTGRRAQLVMTAAVAVVIVALCVFALVWHG